MKKSILILMMFCSSMVYAANGNWGPIKNTSNQSWTFIGTPWSYFHQTIPNHCSFVGPSVVSQGGIGGYGGGSTWQTPENYVSSFGRPWIVNPDSSGNPVGGTMFSVSYYTPYSSLCIPEMVQHLPTASCVCMWQTSGSPYSADCFTFLTTYRSDTQMWNGSTWVNNLDYDGIQITGGTRPTITISSSSHTSGYRMCSPTANMNP